ncbi:MAG: DUF1302 family protein [Rhizobiales bacterium]|nr:DUF1302 family protein [Hyphomicrobiales bacterium]
MPRVSMRAALLGTAVSAVLAVTAGTAQAVEYNFGEVQVFFDTTISAGASIRSADTETRLLPTSNGGPLQATSSADINVPLIPTNGGTFIPLHVIQAPTSLNGSINTDDGRLNFDNGDLTGAPVKMLNDLQVKWSNYTFFARLNSYYDAVLANDGSYARSDLVQGEADTARNVKLLDFYASANYTVMDFPVSFRAGKQVINWGESTFIQNGINAVNPVDVASFRRPGSEVKDFLTPVWALDASFGLPFDMSLEAFYQLKWSTYDLDRAGTPFAGSDVAAVMSGVGGNELGQSFLTGGPGGNIMRNCSTPTAVSSAFSAAYLGAATAYGSLRDCSAYNGTGGTGGFGDSLDYSFYNNTIAGLGGWPVGNTEALRLAYGDTSVVTRDQDREARDSGQWGVALKWYSAELNNTEFGFYFMNYHSRLPIASERVRVDPSQADFTTQLATGPTSSGTTRGLPYQGCNIGNGLANLGQDPTTNAVYGAPIGLTPQQFAVLNQTVGNDSNGLYAAGLAVAEAYYANTTPADHLVVPSPNGGANIFAGGIEGADISAAMGFAAVVNPNSIIASMIINCALVAEQSAQPAAGTTLLTDGSEILFAANLNDPSLGFYLEYPEDIKMAGFSFNTTIGTWGVQGEATYRPNAPVQLDTDQLTIAALNSGCVFQQLLGPTSYNALIPGATGLANPDTYGTSCGTMGTGSQSRDIKGYVDTKLVTAQVGTTATYSNSNPLIGFTGADLGILVTEFGAMYAPDAPSNSGATLRWGNVCTTGTDLPLGGFLSLASRTGCRPDNFSWGYNLLGVLQYNNVFGTPITLSPTVAFSHDVHGNSPAPYSNYRENRKSIALSLNGSYQSWRGGISYTNFFGSTKYNSATDLDYASLNISYSF